jgi:hypothetical protein
LKKRIGNAENGTDGTNSKKKLIPLAKNARIAIIAAVCVVLLALAVGLPVGLTLSDRNTTPSPLYESFDQSSDYGVRVSWNKIRKADGYNYQYCYGNPSDESSVVSDECYTQNTTTVFERHKGTVAFRVKAAVGGEDTSYSDWITMEVDAWKLSAPIVTVGSDLSVGWTACTYKYYDKNENVPSYAYNISFDGDWIFAQDMTINSNQADLSEYLLKCITEPDSATFPELSDKISDYYLGYGWQGDITVQARVKSLNYKTSSIFPSDTYASLTGIYDESDYEYATITVTQTMFDGFVNK